MCYCVLLAAKQTNYQVMKLNKSNVVTMFSELEMLGFLKTNGTNCQFVAITTKTPVVKIKKGNPWHVVKSGKVQGDCNLFKVSRKLGIINANYCDSVARRIADKLGVPEKEVEYVAGEVWYEHLTTADGKNLPIVQHKDEAKRGEFYLQYFPQKSENSYCNGNGEPVLADEVAKWAYAESERPDYKPAVIAVKLSNVHQLKASGVVLEMPELSEVQAVFAD
jgi:hypothetical protein